MYVTYKINNNGNIELVTKYLKNEYVNYFQTYRDMIDTLGEINDDVTLPFASDNTVIHPATFDFIFEFANYLFENEINDDNWEIYMKDLSEYDNSLSDFIINLLKKYTKTEDEMYKELYISVFLVIDFLNMDLNSNNMHLNMDLNNDDSNHESENMDDSDDILNNETDEKKVSFVLQILAADYARYVRENAEKLKAEMEQKKAEAEAQKKAEAETIPTTISQVDN